MEASFLRQRDAYEERRKSGPFLGTDSCGLGTRVGHRAQIHSPPETGRSSVIVFSNVQIWFDCHSELRVRLFEGWAPAVLRISLTQMYVTVEEHDRIPLSSTFLREQSDF